MFPFFYGLIDFLDETRGYVDGGVYMVSNEAVNVFNQIMKNDSICPDFHRAEEDQEVCSLKLDA